MDCVYSVYKNLQKVLILMGKKGMEFASPARIPEIPQKIPTELTKFRVGFLLTIPRFIDNMTIFIRKFKR